MKKKTKRILSRKYMINYLIGIVLAGLMFGIAIYRCFEFIGVANFVNMSICMILYVLFCLFLWLPLCIPVNQIIEVEDHLIRIIPSYSSWKKINIAFYTLLNDHAAPFLRTIQTDEIQKAEFLYTAHWGSYAYQRFSFIIKLHIGKEVMKIEVNPMQNGVFLPSGKGGIPAFGNMGNNDIINFLQFLSMNGVDVEDRYKIQDAMKDESVPLYDYLVSLKKNITY